MCVLIFSTNLSQKFLILRIIQRIYTFPLPVMYFLVTECVHRSKLIERGPRERLLFTRFVSICSFLERNVWTYLNFLVINSWSSNSSYVFAAHFFTTITLCCLTSNVTSLAVYVLLMGKSPCYIWSQAPVKVTRSSVVCTTTDKLYAVETFSADFVSGSWIFGNLPILVSYETDFILNILYSLSRSRYFPKFQVFLHMTSCRHTVADAWVEPAITIFLDPEDRRNIIHRKVGNYVPVYMVSYAGKFASSSPRT